MTLDRSSRRRTKLVLAAAAGALGLFVATPAPGRTAPAVVAAAAAAGFVAPDVLRARARRAHVQLATRELPDMLDLLRVTVQAGEPPVQAVAAVGAEFEGALAARWRRVAMLAELGEPLDRALNALDDALPCEEV